MEKDLKALRSLSRMILHLLQQPIIEMAHALGMRVLWTQIPLTEGQSPLDQGQGRARLALFLQERSQAEQKLFAMFVTMLDGSFRAGRDVVAWVKERFVQGPPHREIPLVGLTQQATDALERVICDQSDEHLVE